MTRSRIACLAVALALGAAFFSVAGFRRDTLIPAVIGNDAGPGPAPRLPAAEGAGLSPSPRVRVVLIDGAGAATAGRMPTWNALCARGLDLTLDVGFPTVSLPVQVALWTGRSQQQTGILYHSGKPLVPPLAAPAIPPQVSDAIAIAESHAYIIQSLGFADARPPLGKLLPDGWAEQWVPAAIAAVAGPARLTFVHILRVDTAGHRHGRQSAAWMVAAAGADAILAQLLAAAPDARWLVLADHDHLPTGGHASEEPAIRVVRACLAGPEIAVGRGGPVSVLDLSRALADSLGVRLADDAQGRPLWAALAAPVGADDVLPSLPAGRVALALLVVGLGLVASGWGVAGRWQDPPRLGRWRLLAVPWWWPVALLSLVIFETAPTLSTPFIYKPKGLDLAQAMAPGLGVLGASLAALARRGWGRAVVAQLGLPLGATVAVVIVTGAAPLVWGAAVCPVVPRWTGWLSPLLLNAAMAAAVGSLGLLASAVLPGSGPSAPPGTRRSGPAAR